MTAVLLWLAFYDVPGTRWLDRARPVAALLRAAVRLHARLFPATGQHAVPALALTRGLDGLLHHPGTGPMAIPAAYLRDAERGWWMP